MSKSDSDEVDEANLPSREVCEERCQTFADLTSTDTALAMFYLQDRDWDVQRALNAFYEENEVQEPAKKQHVKSEKTSTSKKSTEAEDPEPHRIRLISWNIDGLDTANLKARTQAVAAKIKAEKPDVVFLQEVVPQSLELLEELCPDYQALPGNHKSYFSAMLLKCSTVVYEDHSVTEFFSSMMGRNLIHAKVSVKGVKMELLTSHLESTASHGAERIKQFKMALEKVTTASPQATVIFGGDLNIRDKEIAQAGIPDSVMDLWEVTGKRPEAKFTWDMTRNDNLSLDFRPKCRFDRLYIRHCARKPTLKPVYFELIGLERIPQCRRFPSDHWGLLAHFDKV